MERYGDRDDGKTKTKLESPPYVDELNDWKAKVHLIDKGYCEILCSPEDITCADHKLEAGTLCSNCSIPLCYKCHVDLHGPPPLQDNRAML